MTRKDSEKESERPHYYSQFWLDIAAGRRTIGGPKPEDEGELLDDAPEPVSLRQPLRSEPDEDLDESSTNTRHTTSSRPSVTPVADDEDVQDESDDESFATDDSEDFSQDEDIADADIPDMDLAADEDLEDEEDEDEDEELFDEDEDEDEDEEDEGWSSRGRKKPSPKRPTKQPPARRPRRDTRRSY